MTDKIHYPGGKAGDGVYQTIINQIPPHDLYIEPFAGGFAIGRHKRPAVSSIAIDADGRACETLRGLGLPGLTVIHGDAISLLRDSVARTGKQSTFVYADPPYLRSVRSDKSRIYAHEFWTDVQHRELLNLLKSLGCMVMISGYWSELYAQELSSWRTVSFNSVVRSGAVRREWLWMNYPEPVALHDYAFMGDNYRERERIKRKMVRWRERLRKMDVLERRAILWGLQEAGIIESVPR
jgi:hypothetical protein